MTRQPEFCFVENWRLFGAEGEREARLAEFVTVA
jgi:hypothetical protein